MSEDWMSFAGMGLKPLSVYAAATLFNLFTGLLLAYLLFGGLLGI